MNPYGAQAEKGGAFPRVLIFCAVDFTVRRFLTPLVPELDIVIFAVNAESADESSRMARTIFEDTAKKGLHLALANLPVKLFPESMLKDRTQEYVTCLRSCLMKPEHLDWLDEIWQKLDLAMVDAGQKVLS